MDNNNYSTPREYEEFVGKLFEEKGYKVSITPLSNDWGIDTIAIKGEEKIGIQAKMYGNCNRNVNKRVIMELYGAAAYQNCTKVVLATDGDVLPDAKKVADKLGIEILYTRNFKIQTTSDTDKPEIKENNHSANKYPTFDVMWKKYIIPLKGETLKNSRGDNKIINVDSSGIERLTSNGKKRRIKIEGFEFAYNELINKGQVTRNYIDQQFDKRCSSGIVLILSKVPFIKLKTSPLELYLQ